MTTETDHYAVKCDNCKIEIGRTDSVRTSAEGGRCVPCRTALLSRAAVEIIHGQHVTRYFYSQPDDLGRRAFTDYWHATDRGQAFFAEPEAFPLA